MSGWLSPGLHFSPEAEADDGRTAKHAAQVKGARVPLKARAGPGFDGLGEEPQWEELSHADESQSGLTLLKRC